MPTVAALEGYINDTFSTLFSLAAAITGWQSPEIEHLARHAGLAQGMAYVASALPLDSARRQLFLPLQVLESHGSSAEEVFSRKDSQKLRAALSQLLGDARAHLETAFALLESVPPEVRPVFLPLSLVARDLRQMKRSDSNPFTPRTVSRLATLWTLWRASRSGLFS